MLYWAVLEQESMRGKLPHSMTTQRLMACGPPQKGRRAKELPEEEEIGKGAYYLGAVTEEHSAESASEAPKGHGSLESYNHKAVTNQ